MAREHILLIEDNALQAKTTRQMLEKSGYVVVVSNTGAKGFKLSKSEGFDLILLDLVLPDFSGEQICQWIKRDEETSSIPVIMLSSKDTIKDKVSGFEKGADDYLSKPFNEDELLARIRAFLRIKRLQDELRGKNKQLENALKAVEIEAITDPGTGLFNRRHFYDILDKEFTRAKRFSEPLSCLLMDIDHFKSINDTYGHQAGDTVLFQIGEMLKEKVRLIEVAARYGGEEFVLLLPKTPLEEARKPAERILETVSGFRFDGIPADRTVTVSIGISALPDEHLNKKDDLIRCADLALYKAKNKGRNRIEVSSGVELEDETTSPHLNQLD